MTTAESEVLKIVNLAISQIRELLDAGNEGTAAATGLIALQNIVETIKI